MTKYHDREENTEGARLDLRDSQNEKRRGAPLISVVIPCYNQAHFLGEAIESVLAQSYPHFEIVVVDDGSTDNTSEVAGRYPEVLLVRQDNRGLSGARNSGLSRSKGEYIVFLDADDRLLPRALEVGLDSLKDHPECAFVSGRYRPMADNGLLLPKWPQHIVGRDHPYAALLNINYIAMHATVMYRRAVFDLVGDFDTSLGACEDYELYLRIARRFPICNHEKVVAEYRKHESSMSCDRALMLRSSLRVLRSQRTYIKGNRRYEEAYKTGVRAWKTSYGVPLARQILTRMREREWKRATGDLLVLTRYNPGAFIRAFRKLIGS